MPAQKVTPIRTIATPLALRSAGDPEAFTRAAESNVQDMHDMGVDINSILIPAINAAVGPLNTLVDNLPAVQNAAGNATTASQKAAAAASSATAAATSATTANTKAGEASSSATAAAAAKTAAETARTGAQAAETNATASKNAAAASATNAATSAATASTKAGESAKSAMAAETAKTAAQTADTNATASKNAAATSATNAATSATAAQTAKTAAEKARDEAQKIVIGEIPDASETVKGLVKYGTLAGTAAQGNHDHAEIKQYFSIVRESVGTGWMKLASASMGNANHSLTTTLFVSGALVGGTLAGSAIFSCCVRNGAAGFATESSEFECFCCDRNFSPSNFRMFVWSNGLNTRVELWGKAILTYRGWVVKPVTAEIEGSNGYDAWTFHNFSGVPSDPLPTDAQYEYPCTIGHLTDSPNLNSSTIGASAAAIAVRTSSVAIYISKTGNDANNGLSEATAVLTATRAIDIAVGLRLSRNAAISFRFGPGEWGKLELRGGMFSCGFVEIKSITTILGTTEKNSNLPVFTELWLFTGRFSLTNVITTVLQAVENAAVTVNSYCKFSQISANYTSSISLSGGLFDIAKAVTAVKSLFVSQINSNINVINAGTTLNFLEDCAYSDATIYASYEGSICFYHPRVTFAGVAQTGRNFISQFGGVIIIVSNPSKTYFPGNGTYILTTGGSYCGQRVEDAKPTTIDGIGKWQALRGSHPIVLPVGGTWAYSISLSGGIISLAGVAAGGTVVTTASTGGATLLGFAWRIA